MTQLFIVAALLMSSHVHAALPNKSKYFKSQKAEPDSVVVGVVDTGADVEHRLLQNYIWTNSGETGVDEKGQDKATNGIDDDHNGFIDDVHGWNFVNNNNNVFDTQGHGTHVSGIIVQRFKEKEVLNGENAKLKLMILKYYDVKASGEKNLHNTRKAFLYAQLMKAHIINYSAGGAVADFQEAQILKTSEKLGQLIVVAAGNESSDIEKQKYFPASYKFKHVLSVGSLNKNQNELSSFSNYGVQTVDVVAPGQFIMSAQPHNEYGVMSGTSQATAFVTGLIAYEWGKQMSFNKLISAQLVKTNIFQQAKVLTSLQGLTKNQLALVSP